MNGKMNLSAKEEVSYGLGAVGKDRKMRKKMQKQFGAMDPEALKEFENSGGSE